MTRCQKWWQKADAKHCESCSGRQAGADGICTVCRDRGNTTKKFVLKRGFETFSRMGVVWNALLDNGTWLHIGEETAEESHQWLVRHFPGIEIEIEQETPYRMPEPAGTTCRICGALPGERCDAGLHG